MQTEIKFVHYSANNIEASTVPLISTTTTYCLHAPTKMNTGTATLMLMCLSVLAVRHTQAKALKTEVAKQDDVDILSSEASSAESGVKRKRSYYSPNQNYVSLLDASQVWRPATYTISRPYVIPVFSISNRYPIFYPPQSVYSNPGSPVDNPLKPPYQAPEYLPPKTTSKPNTDVGDRLGGDDDNDAPVWGTVEMVGMPLSGNVDKESEVTPTRAPRPSQSRPPLIHNTQSVTTTTTTPTPPPPRAASGPSNCVWAIVSCCSASSPKDYSNSCFEQRGCPGPFWEAARATETSPGRPSLLPSNITELVANNNQFQSANLIFTKVGFDSN